MADRFPIILNTSTNQLQELASGDNLDLTGSGIKSSGITTFTTSAQLNLGGGTNITQELEEIFYITVQLEQYKS